MRNRIYMADQVGNTERKFGSALSYVPLRVVNAAGEVSTALFTEAQVYEAVARAEKNPEDLPPMTVMEWLGIQISRAFR